MTLPAFLAALEGKAPRTLWTLHPVMDGVVPRSRLRSEGICARVRNPRACLTETDIAEAHAAGRRMGRSADDSLRIMAAAGDVPGHGPPLRQRLLQAVGREECAQ